LLPVGGIGFLRLYESALIRQTEAELLAQAAVLSAAYRAAWLERASPEALAALPAGMSDWGLGPRAAVLPAPYRAAWLEGASPEALAALPAVMSDWGVAPTPASPDRWRTLL